MKETQFEMMLSELAVQAAQAGYKLDGIVLEAVPERYVQTNGSVSIYMTDAGPVLIESNKVRPNHKLPKDLFSMPAPPDRCPKCGAIICPGCGRADC
jgi:hypothetical protein